MQKTGMTMLRTALLAAGLLAGLGTGSARAADDAASPSGKGYLVQVFGSDGDSFLACLFFDRSGKLFVEGYGTLLYRFDELNDQTDAFQALNANGKIGGFYLSFHGTVAGVHARTIASDVLNSFGTTFILKGATNSGCSPSGPAARAAARAAEWK